MVNIHFLAQKKVTDQVELTATKKKKTLGIANN